MTPVAVGIFQGRELLSAPVQLHPVDDLARRDLPQAVADGEIFQVNGQYLQPTRVVYTGATMAELRDLDAQAGTANFDFYLWFRYDGDDDATDIQFVNQASNFMNQASNGPLLGAPLEEATIDGLKYRLYRVRGVFKQNLDFKDYPFDRQLVSVQLRNAKLPRSRIIYVVDRRGLAAAGGGDLLDNATEFANVDNWHVHGPVRLSQDTVSQASSFGDPRLFGREVKLDFSEFHIDITLGRDLLSFLLRNVLPLGLVLAILYISLVLFARGPDDRSRHHGRHGAADGGRAVGRHLRQPARGRLHGGDRVRLLPVFCAGAGRRLPGADRQPPVQERQRGDLDQAGSRRAHCVSRDRAGGHCLVCGAVCAAVGAVRGGRKIRRNTNWSIGQR